MSHDPSASGDVVVVVLAGGQDGSAGEHHVDVAGVPSGDLAEDGGVQHVSGDVDVGEAHHHGHDGGGEAVDAGVDMGGGLDENGHELAMHDGAAYGDEGVEEEGGEDEEGEDGPDGGRHKSSGTAHDPSHGEEKPFKCEHCDYRARQRSAVVSHERTHTGEKPYACSQCEYRSRSKSALIAHERVHEAGQEFKPRMPRASGENKILKCQHCDYTSGKSNMIKHERIHTGDKPYKCAFCEYRSGDRSVIALHQRIHTGEGGGARAAVGTWLRRECVSCGAVHGAVSRWWVGVGVLLHRVWR